ncbi:MAG TPA: isochorismatase family protein [Microlunatus sp.]|nr:isochorismatase family protein [Microlunatus sp.]
MPAEEGAPALTGELLDRVRPILSDVDAAVLAHRAKDRPFGLGCRPALLLVDLYYAAVGRERVPLPQALDAWPLSCGLDGWAAVDATVPLVAAARAAGIPVIHVTGMGPDFTAPWARQARDRSAHDHEFIAEVAPRPGETIIRKPGPSAFNGTALPHLLQYHGVDTLLVCGETTSGCVHATVVDAATLRFRIGIVDECCFDRVRVMHDLSLLHLDQLYGDVIAAGSAIGYLRQVAGPE